jgi:peptidoglycan-associated lipoprotein
MIKKSLSIMILFFCIGLLMMGCPKKTVVKDQPSVTKEEAVKLEAARAEKEKAEREAREKDQARMKEEEARRAEEARKAKEKEFEKSLAAKKTPGIEGEVLESKLLKDNFFDFDQYTIRLQDLPIMKENAATLTRHPNVKIQIEGNCDERGTNEYNLALGERRANSTKKHLISLGISPDRISTISYGEEKPLDPGHNEEAWAKNRRAHIVILSK